MLGRIGFTLLLAFSQVLTEEVSVQYLENVKDTAPSGPSSRIVSGWPALPGQLPHQVSLRMVNSAGEVSSCGGSVVHRSWVVTAAHCTAQQVTLIVRAGLVSLTKPAYIDETQTWYIYPTYNANAPAVVQPNDISIVKLNNLVPYSPLIKAVKIQPQGEAFRDYSQTNEIFYTSGFGRTWTDGDTSEDLNWVYLKSTSNVNCASLFGTSLITQNTICAAFYNVTSQSVCQGDSGGPLVHVDSDGVPTLVGVTSFVAGNPYGCHSGLPAGFIRPGPFLSWFQEKTGIDFENIEEEEEITTVAPTTPLPTTTEEYTTTTTTEEPTTTTEEPSPTTPEPESPTTSKPEEPEEPDSEEESSSSSEENEDKELADLMKRLEVEVKVKVKMDKLKKKTHVHEVHES